MTGCLSGSELTGDEERALKDMKPFEPVRFEGKLKGLRARVRAGESIACGNIKAITCW